VPQAVVAFLESENFTDAVRNAISIGGDSDTIGAMTGALAEAFYGGVPVEIIREVWKYLDDELQETVQRFSSKVDSYNLPGCLRPGPND
jgi:ADP-ribosylglycohydrolase